MEFIDDQQRADNLLNRLLESPSTRAFYLDLEADNFHHYEEILCTVQVCVGGDFYLLDALNLDLTTAFTQVLQEKEIWLHGSDYDLYLLNRYLKTQPQKLHDTQIAARLCGVRKFGYAPLVEQVCGIKLPKDSQRSDWTKRPLSDKMIEYAKNDVRYLPQLSDLLMTRLDRLKRLDWFRESCDALVTNVVSHEKEQSEDRWRIAGSGNCNPDVLRYLEHLYRWRDAQAKKADKPPFKVINNQTMLKWAGGLAKGENVAEPKNMSSSRRRLLREAIETARDLPSDQWPAKAPRQRGPRVKIDEDALNALIANRDKVADQLNIESSYIASRKVLEAIVKSPDAATSLLNWQRELLQL